MSVLTQFAGAKPPVGSIVQAPYNLTDSDYLPCDGRAVLRATYPLLSACLPNIGTFTATARTKPFTPTSSAIAANGTVWVVTGAVGTNNLYTTPDGITYTARTTPTAACDVRSILWDGVNFVAAVQAGSNGTLYSSDGGVTWTATVSTSAVTASGALQTCMTHAPTLGTVGRFCMVVSNGNFFTSDDRGVTWTSRSNGLGGTVFHVCWTGQKFIALTGTQNVIYTSTDGITWVSQATTFFSQAATANTGSIISDGAGKVLWIDQNKVITSLDHGVTWAGRAFGVEISGGILSFSNPGTTAWYTNGRFFFHGNQTFSSYSSVDLIGWAQSKIAATISTAFGISHKAGVYLINNDNSTTAAFTAVEDTSRIALPGSSQNAAVSNGSWNNFMPFIKVK